MSDQQYKDLGQLPIWDQVFLLKEALECFATDPSLDLQNRLTKFEVQVCISDFLKWVLKQDITTLNSTALSNHMAESHKIHNSLPDLFHQLLSFKTFFEYTVEHGFFPNICTDFYPKLVGYHAAKGDGHG